MINLSKYFVSKKIKIRPLSKKKFSYNILPEKHEGGIEIRNS